MIDTSLHFHITTFKSHDSSSDRTMHHERGTVKQQPKEYLRCAQCGPDPAAHRASTDGGLMQHMGQKHGGQQLLPDSVEQLRRLDRAAVSDHNIATDAAFATAIRELRVGDTFKDRRQPRHQKAALGETSMDQELLQSSQPVPPGDPDDSPLPNCPIRDTVFTERDKHPLAGLRRASAMALPRCVVSRIRYGLGRKPRRSHDRSPVLGSVLSLPLSSAPC